LSARADGRTERLFLAVEAGEVMIRELLAENAGLGARLARLQTAIDSLSAGVGCFHGGDRLIASRQTFAEIDQATPEPARAETGPRKIAERRIEARVGPATPRAIFVSREASKRCAKPPGSISPLPNGRPVRIADRTVEGGRVVVHEGEANAPERPPPIDEMDSAQSRIASAPNPVCGEDRRSRFIIAAVARARPLDAARTEGRRLNDDGPC